ncbi:MAG: multicopper oxidase family protein [Chloroflexota bacterium]|nr:multicopper oxidase family protein [Chloroflexota bacterium]
MPKPEPLVAHRSSLERRVSGQPGRQFRRRLLSGAVAGAGLAALAGGGSRTWSAARQGATPAAFVPGAAFIPPRELRSTDGRLDVALQARFGPARMGERDVTTYTYDGEVPGPTLRLRPGDTLGVSLANQMDESTNFHTHGLHVSPMGNSDNVLLKIGPHEQIDLAFDIPRDRTSGLYIPGFYWYHPHLHGNTSQQVGGGMAGALIVEGALDELPGIAGLPERLLILRAAFFDDDGVAMLPHGDDEPAVFVNGQMQPTLAIAPGETQRWRLLNASIFTFMNVSLEGHQLHQIASDGNPLREVWSRDAILIAPGERVEVLVQGGPAGRYTFRSLPWAQDSEFQAQPDYPLATLVSEGPGAEPGPLPSTLFAFEDLRAATIDRRREVVFSETFDPFRTLLDGRTFDHDRVDQRVSLGATEEWVLRNSSSDTHPFHIHVNDFQVVSINGEPFAARSWEDTTSIPAFGEIVIRTRFLDFPGTFVYHCHILDHEDRGMMGVVEVVDDAAAAR